MANAVDLLTLAEAKAAVNLSGDANDTELALWITAVSVRIDDLCGAVVTRTVTGEKHDGGRRLIVLRKAPASDTSTTTITTVTEYVGTTGTTLTEDDNTDHPAAGWYLDGRRLYRRAGGTDARFAAGRGNVVVTYEAGRFANTEAVGPLFKLTVSAIMRRLWSREQGSWASGGDPFAADSGGGVRFHKTVDPMVREFLTNELLPPVVM